MPYNLQSLGFSKSGDHHACSFRKMCKCISSSFGILAFTLELKLLLCAESISFSLILLGKSREHWGISAAHSWYLAGRGRE